MELRRVRFINCSNFENNVQKEIRSIFKESAELKLDVADLLAADVEKVALKIIESYQNGGKLLIFGNGGSAADAQHFEAELVHQFEKRRKCLLALALTTNSSTMLAIGNDWSFDKIFERQIEGLATEKDIVIGISTSGNSPNVIKGIEQAKKNGAYSIVFSGNDGGQLKDVADLSLIVPSNNTARIQECHITTIHILCRLIENNLFPSEDEINN